jgi:hypothetical protein
MFWRDSRFTECARSADLARRTECERASLEALLGATTNRLRTVDRSRFLTSTDESASGVQSQVAPRGAARADDYLKEEETE